MTVFAKLINQFRQVLSSAEPYSGHVIETVLVRHSMGCRIVLEAFSQEPTHVSGIVLLDGSWYGREAEEYTISDSVN